MAGLAYIPGLSGKTNIQAEEVRKLDEFANNTIKRRMARCGYLSIMTSEGDDLIPVTAGYEGQYTLAFIVEQADGRVIVDDGTDILDIQPEPLHQRVLYRVPERG